MTDDFGADRGHYCRGGRSLVPFNCVQGEYFQHTTESDDALLGWQPLELIVGKRAIVHAHAICHSKVELETWTEDDTDTTFFRVTDEVNDEIMDSLAQLF